MHFDCSRIAPRDSYKLLISTVVPRPIALVTSVDREGRVNAAPFSFFNAMDFDPPTVVLGLEARPDGRLKDTAANIQASGEFVVNVVDEALARRMIVCAIRFEPETSEIEQAGLELLSSVEVAAPRLAASPAALECRAFQTIERRHRRHIVLAEVLHFHVRDDLVLDRERCHVDTLNMKAIGRLNAASYTTTTDNFEMPLIEPEDWFARR